MFISEEEFYSRLKNFDLPQRLGREITPPSTFDLPAEVPNFAELLDLPTSSESEKEEIEENAISDASIDQLLSSLIPGSYKGRGTKSLHRDTQAAIGVTASLLGTTKASRLNDVAISSAHSYERGYTGPVDLVNPEKSPKAELQEKIIAGHSIVVDKAFNRLLKTLELLDDDKLAGVKRATDLSVIAKNMSSIVSHAASVTQDKIVDASEKSVHFHIMRPEIGTEEDYPTITIGATASPDYVDPTKAPE